MTPVRCAAVFSLLLGLAGCATVSMKAGFDTHCRSAGLNIVERVNGPRRVLFEQSAVPYRMGLQRIPLHVASVARISGVEYADVKTTTATRYRRHRRDLSPELVRETDANILLKVEPLTSDADHEVDLFGEQVTISERSTGRVYATYRYFWTMGALRDYCPKNRTNSPQPNAVAAYVIGLPDRSRDEHVEREYLSPPRKVVPR
jgi:hypothetical protein